MKTNKLALHTGWIRTQSLDVRWYSNGQMSRHEEMKDGLNHGGYKFWWIDGQLRRYEIYVDEIFAKQIV